jgi:hypothetical protein
MLNKFPKRNLQKTAVLEILSFCEIYVFFPQYFFSISVSFPFLFSFWAKFMKWGIIQFCFMNVIIGFISESVPQVFKLENFSKYKNFKTRTTDHPVLRCRLGRSRRWESLQQDHAW